MNQFLPPHNNTSRAALAEVLQLVTLAILLFQTTIFVIALVLFSTGHSLNAYVLPLAVPFPLLGMLACGTSKRIFAYAAICTVAIHLLSYYLAYGLFDSSWDGMAYHQEAVLRLAAGWNPLIQDAEVFGSWHNLWLNHYPKASWIDGAAVLLTFGHIEAGKLFNFALMIAAAAQVATALLRITALHISAVAAVAALAALNPVFLYQCTSFYVDGSIGSLLTILTGGLLLHLTIPSRSNFVVVLMAILLAVNLKFNGLVYVVILLGGAVVAAWKLRGYKLALQFAVSTGLTGLLAVFLLGYSPYVRNLSQNHHLLYPVVAPSDLLGTATQRPVNVNDHNRFVRFLISNYSRSASLRPPESTHLKIPFSISASESERWWNADVEVGGFGPLYGGLLLLAGLGIVSLLFNGSTRSLAYVILVVEGVLLASVFSHAETWWARYVPQAWLVPIIVATACILSPHLSNTWRLGMVMLTLSAANVAFVGFWHARHAWGYTRAMHRCMEEMKAVKRPVSVDFGPFQSLRQRLLEAKVNFQLVKCSSPTSNDNIPWYRIPSAGDRPANWSPCEVPVD